MTEYEQAELVRDQYATGREHGNTIAAIIMEKFPIRSTRYIRRQVRKILNQSLSNVLNTLIANGVEAKFRQPVVNGFVKGLEECDPELAAHIDQKVTQFV